MRKHKFIFLPAGAVTAVITMLSSLAGCKGVVEDGPRSADEAFVEQLQPRDSILIADQLRYGVALTDIPEGAVVELPPVGDTLCAYIDVVRPWTIDTLAVNRAKTLRNIEASLVVTSFDEGEYVLPGIPVAIHLPDGTSDTLVFKGQDVLFCTIPVDTATFKIHDIKGQIRYPVTFSEVLPWLGGALVLVGLAVLGIVLWKRHRRRIEEAEHSDPPHIVALRKLDSYRGDKYWAPQRQKAFYSGVTDALREYMCARYGIGAMEMTTAEIFSALKHSDLTDEMKNDLRELFERSDYVKFAKYVASDEENAGVLPLGVRFVTTTYQEEIKEESDVL